MRKMRLALTLAFALLSVTWGVSAASASTKSPVSIRFTLSTSEVKAGVPIKATVIITNASATTLMVESCATDGWLWVGLANQTTPFTPAVATVACNASIKLKPGANRFPVTVMTVYQVFAGCGTPHCTTTGPPSLPKGIYHTDVITLGLPKGTPTLTHVRVTLS
jgi:hypothetical protein